MLQSGIVVLWSCRSLPRSWRECKGAAAWVNVLVLQKKGLCLTLLNFNEESKSLPCIISRLLISSVG